MAGQRRRVVVIANCSRSLPGWEEAMARLREHNFEVDDAGRALANDEAVRAVAGAEAMIVAGTHLVPGQVLRAATALRVVSRQGIGVDNIDVDVATERGIVVCNTPGANAEAVADHTFALMLYLLRDLGGLDARTRAGRGWDDGWPPRLAQLAGHTIGVVGTGNIGRRVVRRASAGFGMRVLAHDIAPDPSLAALYGVEYAPLARILPQADVLTLHVPLTALTHHLIGECELAAVKPGAILINTSRGGVVNEAALVQALRSRRLAAAGVDVFATEPCTENDLFRLPNVVLTPHSAAQSLESSINARSWSIDNVLSFFAGMPRNVVNPEALQQCMPTGGGDTVR